MPTIEPFHSAEMSLVRCTSSCPDQLPLSNIIEHLRKIGEPYLDHDEDSGKLVTRRHLINDEDAVVLSEMLRKLKIDGLELSDEQLVSVGNRLDQARYFEGTFRSDTALKLRWEVEADLKRRSREQKLIEREATVALGQLNKFDPRVQRIADWARRTSESEKRAIEGIHQSGAGATSTFLQTMLQRALTIVEASAISAGVSHRDL